MFIHSQIAPAYRKIVPMPATKKHLPEEGSPRESILLATVEAIAAGGESSVRITEVAREAGVTQGMVSYYFKDREGLISEAQLLKFREGVTQDTSGLLAGAMDVRTVEEFQKFLKAVTRDIVDLQRASNRMTRIVALGASESHPDLRRHVHPAQEELIDGLESVVTLAQQRGLIREDLEPRAVAVFVTAYALGLVVGDIDSKRPSDKAISEVVDVFTNGLLLLPKK
jgi:AcrR family transcriptional regulator